MRTRIAGALLLAVPLAGPAYAQAPVGPQFRMNSYTTGYQGQPSVSVDASGNVVVVWLSQPHQGDQSIVARRFDRQGVPRGPELQVSGSTTDLLRAPQVATDPAGGFMVVWEDSYFGFDVWGRVFDANGAPRGGPFLVQAYTSQVDRFPAVASRTDGSFVVVWNSTGVFPGDYDVVGQQFDGAGNRLGSQFIVNSTTTRTQIYPTVATDAGGSFIVVWRGGRDGDSGIFGQRFNAAAAPVGPEFQVHTSTVAGVRGVLPQIAAEPGGGFVVVWQVYRGEPNRGALRARRFDAAGAPQGGELDVSSTTLLLDGTVAMDALGRFVVAWSTFDPTYTGSVHARWYEADGTPRGRAFRYSTATTDFLASVGSDPAGNVVVAWERHQNGANVFAERRGLLRPVALALDTSPSGTSNGNGVLEAGETVPMWPSWENAGSATQGLSGTLTGIMGPSGATYTITDGIGDYGSVPGGATQPCLDCYAVSVSAPPTRPAFHWDARATENINLDNDGHFTWALHVGDSFSDVPRTSPFYRFVEAMLHHGVSSGCGGVAFCPANPTTREQMAPFLLAAKEGAAYVPKECTTPVFGDVPASSPFCRWIEELARRGVTSGCGGGNFCPTAVVSREQMAVFLLRTLDPALNPPACTTPMFSDVPASSPYCKWIEELARRGITGGCGGGNYCPTVAVTREQMAVFLTGTFGLTLYGP